MLRTSTRIVAISDDVRLLYVLFTRSATSMSASSFTSVRRKDRFGGRGLSCDHICKQGSDPNHIFRRAKYSSSPSSVPPPIFLDAFIFIMSASSSLGNGDTPSSCLDFESIFHNYRRPTRGSFFPRIIFLRFLQSRPGDGTPNCNPPPPHINPAPNIQS